MTAQLHITNKSAYRDGLADGKLAAQSNDCYLPNAGATGTADDKLAYRLGYSDGWITANPCDNGTCEHQAHQKI